MKWKVINIINQKSVTKPVTDYTKLVAIRDQLNARGNGRYKIVSVEEKNGGQKDNK